MKGRDETPNVFVFKYLIMINLCSFWFNRILFVIFCSISWCIQQLKCLCSIRSVWGKFYIKYVTGFVIGSTYPCVSWLFQASSPYNGIFQAPGCILTWTVSPLVIYKSLLSHWLLSNVGKNEVRTHNTCSDNPHRYQLSYRGSKVILTD